MAAQPSSRWICADSPTPLGSRLPQRMQLISVGLLSSKFPIPPPLVAEKLCVNVQLINMGLDWKTLNSPPPLSAAELPLNAQLTSTGFDL